MILATTNKAKVTAAKAAIDTQMLLLFLLVLLSIGSEQYSFLSSQQIFVKAYDNGLGRTPPMGWNSWNFFGCDKINEDLIKGVADSLVDSGLAALGYNHLNLDDCWQIKRNASGYIVEDSTKFPSGMASLSAYVRGKGLYFGLYSDSGLYTCQRRPGGLGHEVKDAEMYVQWQIDYLKYDNCYATGMGGGLQQRYKTMRDALNATATKHNSKPIFYSLCEWGVGDPAKWAAAVGNSWRTTGDIQRSWGSILANLDKNDQWHSYAGPGGWNDPDMLQIGTTDKLTISEQRSHFTLWCLIKSPLLLANDLRTIPDEIWKIIANEELIAIHQDPLGQQGYKRTKTSNSIGKSDDPEVWACDLQNGDVAVVLFNRSTRTQDMKVSFGDVVDYGENSDTQAIANTATTTTRISAHVRDLWAKTDLGVYVDTYEAKVPSHDVVALRLSNITKSRIQQPQFLRVTA